MTPTNTEIHDFLITVEDHYGAAYHEGMASEWSENNKKVLDWLTALANTTNPTIMDAIDNLHILMKLDQRGDR